MTANLSNEEFRRHMRKKRGEHTPMWMLAKVTIERILDSEAEQRFVFITWDQLKGTDPFPAIRETWKQERDYESWKQWRAMDWSVQAAPIGSPLRKWLQVALAAGGQTGHASILRDSAGCMVQAECESDVRVLTGEDYIG